MVRGVRRGDRSRRLVASRRMDAAEYEARGLYDPTAPNAADRLALLEWLADRGLGIEQIVEAGAAGRLTAVAGELALRPGAAAQHGGGRRRHRADGRADPAAEPDHRASGRGRRRAHLHAGRRRACSSCSARRRSSSRSRRSCSSSGWSESSLAANRRCCGLVVPRRRGDPDHRGAGRRARARPCANGRDRRAQSPDRSSGNPVPGAHGARHSPKHGGTCRGDLEDHGVRGRRIRRPRRIHPSVAALARSGAPFDRGRVRGVGVRHRDVASRAAS